MAVSTASGGGVASAAKAAKAATPPPPSAMAEEQNDDGWERPGQMFQGTHYILTGPRESRKLVVCVPGIGGIHIFFDALEPALVAQGYRVLRYDLIGRGFSDPPPGHKGSKPPSCFPFGSCCSPVDKDPYSMEAHVAQLHNLLVGLGLVQEQTGDASSAAARTALERVDESTAAVDKSTATNGGGGMGASAAPPPATPQNLPVASFHLIGHSMGGALCVGYADRHTDLVASMTLLTPAGLMDKAQFRLLRMAPCCVQRLIQRCMHAHMENALRNDFLVHHTEVEERVVGFVKRMHRHNPHAHDAFFRSILAFPLAGLESTVQRVAAARIPTLLVWALFDRILPFDPHYARWKALLKTGANIRYEVIEDAAHGFPLERPERTNSIVLRFLKAPPTFLPAAVLNNLNTHPPTITI